MKKYVIYGDGKPVAVIDFDPDEQDGLMNELNRYIVVQDMIIRGLKEQNTTLTSKVSSLLRKKHRH